MKNVSSDMFGTKRGRIHMTSQNLGNLQLRKVKALKRKGDAKASGADSKNRKRNAWVIYKIQASVGWIKYVPQDISSEEWSAKRRLNKEMKSFRGNEIISVYVCLYSIYFCIKCADF